MSLLDSLILGIVQGLTEFLPVSSSGHLVMAEYFLKLHVEDLKSFDIALHFGTLLALLLYFWKDYLNILLACRSIVIKFALHKNLTNESKETQESKPLIGYLLLATLPAVILGLPFGDFLDEKFRHPQSVAMLMIAVGLFFFFAEYIATRVKSVKINGRNTFIIGLAQSCALIPGVSRSGATISAGLVQGIKREEAARFSFLLGSVAIAAATVLSLWKIHKGEFSLPAWDILLVGVGSSFIVGYMAIAFLMKFLKKHTLHIFGVYRVILGFVVLFYLMK